MPSMKGDSRTAFELEIDTVLRKRHSALILRFPTDCVVRFSSFADSGLESNERLLSLVFAWIPPEMHLN